MCQYYFTTNERELLFLNHSNGVSNKKIAKILGKSVSSIGRELKKYTVNGVYSPTYADEQSKNNRSKCGRHKILKDNPSLLVKIQNLIYEKQWSPEQICNRMKEEKCIFQISYGTIYRAIKCNLLDMEPPNTNRKGFERNLRRQGTLYRKKDKIDNRGKFPISNHISERPIGAEQRTEIGHWEIDCVAGKKGGACLVTLVDRKSRFLLSAVSIRQKSEPVRDILVRLIKNLHKNKCKTLTPDRGKEFSKHSEISRIFKHVKFYFPDAYSPWQRGTNENTNGLIREYIPKYTDISKISDEKLQEIVNKINLRPRKCLNWKTPFEIFYNKGLQLI